MKKLLLTAGIFLTCIANAQSFQWAADLGAVTSTISGQSVTSDAAGNAYSTGYYTGITDFDPGVASYTLNSSGYDVYISKLNAAGNFVWARSIGGAGFDNGLSVKTDALGNVYVAGLFQNTADFDPGAATYTLASKGGDDVFVLKLDASGNFVWAKNMGSTSNDRALSMTIDASGNIVTTGYFTGTADFDPGAATFALTSNGGQDIFVSKLDAAGNFVWAKNIGYWGNEQGNAVTVNTAGDVYTTGTFNGTIDFDPGAGTYTLAASGWDVYVSKLDASGNFAWARKMGGTNNESGLSITTDAAGNVLTTGNFAGTADFDPGTATVNIISAGTDDIFISKLDAAGNFVWAKNMGGTGTDYGYSISTDAANNIYTTGFYSGTADFDPNAATYTLAAAGGQDIFVSRLDAAGNFAYALSFGGTGYDNAYCLALDGSGNLFTTGIFQGTADFDPGAGILNLTSAGSYDAYVSKLNAAAVTAVAEHANFENIAIYPNPSGGKITIRTTHAIHTIIVMDGLGRLLQEKNMNGELQTGLELKEPGIYFVHLNGERESVIRKVIISE